MAGDRIVSFVDQTIQAMLERPRMWGSPRCVEGQLMRLLEVRIVALQPEAPLEIAGDVQRAYLAFMEAEIPGSPPTSLFTRVGEDEHRHGMLLRKFCEQMTRRSEA